MKKEPTGTKKETFGIGNIVALCVLLSVALGMIFAGIYFFEAITFIGCGAAVLVGAITLIWIYREYINVPLFYTFDSEKIVINYLFFWKVVLPWDIIMSVDGKYTANVSIRGGRYDRKASLFIRYDTEIEGFYFNTLRRPDGNFMKSMKPAIPYHIKVHELIMRFQPKELVKPKTTPPENSSFKL